jgi:hypothetical protein
MSGTLGSVEDEDNLQLSKMIPSMSNMNGEPSNVSKAIITELSQATIVCPWRPLRCGHHSVISGCVKTSLGVALLPVYLRHQATWVGERFNVG